MLKTGFYDWGFQMNSVFIRAALYDCHDSTSVKKKTLKAIVHHSLLEIMSRLKLALQLSPFGYRSQVIHCSHSEEFTKFHTSKIKFDLFFLIGIHSIQGWTAITRHWVPRKSSTKRLKHTGNLFRKNLLLKDVC